MSKRLKVYVESSVLTMNAMSGVGHATLFAFRALFEDQIFKNNYQPILLAPIGKRKMLEALGLDATIKTIFMPNLLYRALRKYNLFPPMDVFLGKGIYIFPNFWSWPLLFSKSATYVYDMGFVLYPDFVQPKNRKFLAQHFKRWIQRTDKVITISQQVKREITSYGYDADNITVCPLGVDLALYKRTGKNNQISKYKPYILFVGNLEPRKNLSKLVEAYRQLLPEILDVYQLLIIGSDNWNNEQFVQDITMAQRDGYDVILLQDRLSDSEIATYYRNASLLVHPALYEGFGMTLLEAMAAGIPIVASDIPVLHEVAEMAAVYVDPNQPESIAEGIYKVLTDNSLCAKLVAHGYDRCEHFTWQKTAVAINKTIDDLVATGV